MEEYDDITLEIHSSFNDETDYLTFGFNIHVEDEDEDEGKKIGSLVIYVFDGNRMGKSDILFLADGEIGGAADAIHPFNIYSSFNECSLKKILLTEDDEDDCIFKREDFDLYGKIAIIGYMYIDKDYRKQGIGSKALAQTIKYLELIGVSFITVHPSPTGTQGEILLSKEELNQFYEKNGFIIHRDKEVGIFEIEDVALSFV